MSNEHSNRDILILQTLADGHSIDQILKQHPNFTFFDIAAAAHAGAEALDKPHAPRGTPAKIKPERTGYPWSKDEEDRLISQWDQNAHINDIAEHLKRSPDAIKQRLLRLHMNKALGARPIPTEWYAIASPPGTPQETIDTGSTTSESTTPIPPESTDASESSTTDENDDALVCANCHQPMSQARTDFIRSGNLSSGDTHLCVKCSKIADKPPTPPPCPCCDAPLVWRRPRTGSAYSGYFLGCSRYPNCRYIDPETKSLPKT